jgi:hypothetical protein
MMTVEDLRRLGCYRSKQQVYTNVSLRVPAPPGASRALAGIGRQRQCRKQDAPPQSRARRG